MSIYKVVMCAVCGLVFTVLMRKIKDEYALFTIMLINLSLMSCAVILLSPVFEYIKSLESRYPSVGGFAELLFKCTGIGLLCAFASELCRDCSENSLGAKIELLGKCCMIAFCLPMIKTVFEYALDFLS